MEPKQEVYEIDDSENEEVEENGEQDFETKKKNFNLSEVLSKMATIKKASMIPKIDGDIKNYYELTGVSWRVFKQDSKSEVATTGRSTRPLTRTPSSLAPSRSFPKVELETSPILSTRLRHSKSW